MPEFLSDPCLALSTLTPDAIVAWRLNCAVTQRMLLVRIGAWRALAGRTPGTDIALYMEDSVEFSAALLGAWQAGKTVWLTADVLTVSCAALDQSVDAFFGDFPKEWSPLSPATRDSCELPLAPLASDFAALVVHTSGTTGAAQAIGKKFSQLTSEIEALELMFGKNLGASTIIATVSHHHIYGLLFKVLWPLASHRAIQAQSVKYPEELAILLSHGPCVLVASPAHLKRLPTHLRWHDAKMQLQAIFSSGGPLESDTAKSVDALLGQVPIEVYGSSETGGIAWRQQTADGSAAWAALPKVSWRITNEDQLLEVRSSHLDSLEWFRLADRAQLAGTGCFILTGRSDRIVKIEEKRVSLDGIEFALKASDLIDDARVIVIKRDKSLVTEDEIFSPRQRLAAFVVLSKTGREELEMFGKLALNRQLSKFISGTVEQVALPRSWRYLEEMPVNTQGKTTYAQLQTLLDEKSVEKFPAQPRLPRILLLEQDSQRILLELMIPANLFYFAGHFPDAPILPGVVQIDWAILFARQYFDLNANFRALHTLKFQQVIQAQRPIHLELILDRVKNCLNFRYFSSLGQHASGRILFEC